MNDKPKSSGKALVVVGIAAALLGGVGGNALHRATPPPTVVAPFVATQVGIVPTGHTYEDGYKIGKTLGYAAGLRDGLAAQPKRARATLRDVERDWGITGKIPREVHGR